ncbi:tetratricopeptide repeat protein [Symmachiella dynata]|uniref:tetratricopeptide repeat protein n=1 Tax=Symmachiella dynata TaxID=2527995 RepID=UPI001187BFED|nr:tetratricopeptide repeat protein [Symmachiella dynata]QDT48511.1 Tetratricopeptide repeat protein [Symmachiella dynata]
MHEVRAEFEAQLADADQICVRLEYAEFLAHAGETQTAIQQYQQVLRSAESADMPQLRAMAVNQLACLHRQQGEYDTAVVLQRRSLAMGIDHALEGDLAADLGNLAVDAIAAGDLSLAENLLLRSLALETAANSQAGQAADYGNLAIVHGLQRNYRSAIHCLRRALKLHRQLNDVRAIGCDLMNLAAMYEVQQRWDRSESLLQLAVRVLQVDDAADLISRAKSALTETRRIRQLRAFDAQRN